MIDPAVYREKHAKVFPAFFALGLYALLERSGFVATPGIKLFFVTLCQKTVADLTAVDTLVVRKMCENTARELTRHWHGIPTLETAIVGLQFVATLAHEGRWCNPNDPLAIACRSELERLKAEPHTSATVNSLFYALRMRIRLLGMYLND